MLLLQKQEYEQPESSSQGSTFRWDNPLNRALNSVKEKPLQKPPAGGRVNGQGPGSKWGVWYPVDKEAQKSRSSSNMVPTQAMFDKMRDDAVRAAERAVEEKYEKSNKVMFEAFKTWISTGQSQDFNYEQFAAMMKPPATANTIEAQQPLRLFHGQRVTKGRY
jgi:hypothetical protein